MMRIVTMDVPATGTRMGLPDWERLTYDHSDRVELIEGVDRLPALVVEVLSPSSRGSSSTRSRSALFPI